MLLIDLRKYKLIIIIGLLLVLLGSSAMSINWVFKIIYPMKYKSLVYEYADKYDLDPHLVFSIIKAESKFDTQAISKKDAKGLMQIAPITGNWAAKNLAIKDFKSEMLYIPEINIKIGCWYLKTLEKEFNGNIRNMVAAYNAGSGNVRKWLKDEAYSEEGELINIPFGETKKYTKKVLKGYKIYKIIYNESA